MPLSRATVQEIWSPQELFPVQIATHDAPRILPAAPVKQSALPAGVGVSGVGPKCSWTVVPEFRCVGDKTSLPACCNREKY